MNASGSIGCQINKLLIQHVTNYFLPLFIQVLLAFVSSCDGVEGTSLRQFLRNV